MKQVRWNAMKSQRKRLFLLRQFYFYCCRNALKCAPASSTWIMVTNINTLPKILSAFGCLMPRCRARMRCVCIQIAQLIIFVFKLDAALILLFRLPSLLIRHSKVNRTFFYCFFLLVARIAVANISGCVWVFLHVQSFARQSIRMRNPVSENSPSGLKNLYDYYSQTVRFRLCSQNLGRDCVQSASSKMAGSFYVWRKT